ncbi:hypothetical protein [Bifidobacterium callimiconis]|uniref:hypothetical protein n=1 Tax=Bifidobacterium callimiconis TaxID=2306973 RepID=UPI001BDCF632|nr:hypothetical protein [Bifidobacterium callimiconis]
MSPQDMAILVDRCLDDNRTSPLLMLSTPQGSGQPTIDAEALAKATESLMDVAIIDDDELIRYAGELFRDRNQPDLTPYNGAARLLPATVGSSHPENRGTLRGTQLYYTDTVRHRRRLADAILDALPVTPGARRTDAIIDAVCRPRNDDTHPLTSFQRRIHTVIRTPEETDSLADLLLSTDRHLPVVVISHTARQRPAFVDIDLLTDLLHDIAPIVEITSRKATETLCDRLCKPAWLYGEAGRVYPTGTEWNSPDAKMRLFLPNAHVSRMLLTNMMASEALLRHADTLRNGSADRTGRHA